MREGKEPKAIRAYIDAEYSRYGPPTDTDPIEAGQQNSCSEPATDTCEDDLAGPPGLLDTTTLPQMTVPEGPNN